MADVAQLGIVVTQKGLKESTKDLDNLSKAAERADKAVKNLGTSSKGVKVSGVGQVAKDVDQAAAKVESAQKRMTKAVKEGTAQRQAALSAEAKFRETVQIKTSTYGKELGEKFSLTAGIKGFSKETQDWSRVMGTSLQGLVNATAEMKRFQKEANQAQGALKTFFNTVERNKAGGRAINVGSTLKRAEQLGVSGAGLKAIETDLKAYNNAVQQAGEHTGFFTDMMRKFGFTTARSRTELIVLGHEATQGNWKKFGGSMMVLAEQADLSQIALTALRSPITWLIASAALLGTSFLRAESEIKQFNLATTTTGNYAGLTASHFESLADTMSKTGQVTVGTAKDIEIALVKSGRVGAEAFDVTAKSVADFMTVQGLSAEKAVDATLKIFEHPARMAHELNMQYGFLDQSQIREIRRLDEVGDHAAAAHKLMEDFHNYMGTKAVASVGLLTGAWHDFVTMLEDADDRAGKFLAKLMATGSAKKQMQYDDVTDEIRRTKEEMKGATPQRQYALSTVLQGVDGKGGLYKQQADLAKELKPSWDKQAAATHQAAMNKQGEELGDGIETMRKHLLDKTGKFNRDIDKLNRQFFTDDTHKTIRPELIASKKYKDADAARKDYNNLVAMATEKLPRQKAAPSIDSHSGKVAEKTTLATELQGLQQLASAQKALNGYVDEELLKRIQGVKVQKEETDLEASIKSMQDRLDKDKGGLTKDTRDSLSKQIAAQQQIHDNLVESRSVTEALEVEENKILAAKHQQLEPMKLQDQAELAHIEHMKKVGEITNRQAEIQKDNLARKEIELEYQIKINAAMETYNALKNNPHTKKEAGQALERVKALQGEKESALQKYDNKEQQGTGELDWVNGIKNGWDNALGSMKQQTENIAGQMEKIFTGSVDGMTDAIVKFTQTGKLDFKSFALSMITEMEKMIVKMLLVKAIESMIGFAGGGSTAIGGEATTGTIAGASYGSYDSGSLNSIWGSNVAASSAKGNAFVNGSVVQSFAKGGAFTNGIVDTPTYTPLSEMGEAGPEAVMPLTRDPTTGKLGVSTSSSSSSGSSGDTNVHINIDASGGTTSGVSGVNANNAKALGVQISNAVKAVIVQEKRQGGLLYS